MTSYRWQPDEYERSSSQQKKWGLEVIGRLRLRGDERILDVGCGDGYLTAILASRVPSGEVVGVDVSPEMIEHASRRFPRQRHPNLRFVVMDASSLSFREEFDLVFSNAALHWIPEHGPVLRGIRESLKRGGRFVAQMAGSGNAHKVAAALMRVMSRPEWAGYFRDLHVPYRFFSDDQYRALLEENGLRPLRVALIGKDMVHQGREGMAGWIRSTWLPFTQKVPEGLREEFITSVVDEYLAEFPPDGEGLVHVEAIRLEVEAEKP
ncbi:MAG: methyltransferase domain-containing protein [Candidatus Geothermincolales bacterium]